MTFWILLDGWWGFSLFFLFHPICIFLNKCLGFNKSTTYSTGSFCLPALVHLALTPFLPPKSDLQLCVRACTAKSRGEAGRPDDDCGGVT